jgi:hypothetical protein
LTGWRIDIKGEADGDPPAAAGSNSTDGTHLAADVDDGEAAAAVESGPAGE